MVSTSALNNNNAASVASSSLVSPTSDLLKVDTTRTANQELNKDAFMNLLITQMKYQDPLNPMDNSQMMAQMAQFSALEQMKNVAKTAEKQIAYDMIGKQVQYTYTDETGSIGQAIGKIDYVRMQNGSPLFGIGDKEVEMDAISHVIDPSNIQSSTSAFEVLGKTVQASVTLKNAEGKEETAVVEGKVLSINMKDGTPYVVIGTGGKDGKPVEVEFSKVQNIVQTPSITNRMVTATVKGEDGKKQTISGIAEYITIIKDGTYVYVKGEDGKGHYVDFDNITSIKDK